MVPESTRTLLPDLEAIERVMVEKKSANLNSLTAIGPYMAYRFSWALLELNNFLNFCPFATCLIAQNVARGFNLTSDTRVRVRASGVEDMS
jgi:hypothetical protein